MERSVVLCFDGCDHVAVLWTQVLHTCSINFFQDYGGIVSEKKTQADNAEGSNFLSKTIVKAPKPGNVQDN